MSAVDEQSGSTGTGAVAARPPSGKIPAKTIVSTVVVVVGLLFLFFVLPTLTRATTGCRSAPRSSSTSVVALGLALLMGRVGMVSLGQIALLALGGWVALRLGFATGLPFPLLLLAAGCHDGCSA